MIELDDVRRAAARLDGVAHRTPVITSRTLDARTGATVRLKPENLQRIGAFKFRGAYNTVASLPEAERRRGVVTASSGNHAQALTLAAALHEIPATILMPEDAPASKAAATEGYGARIVRFDRYADDREALMAEWAERDGLAIVHPYDDERIMAGQGTAGLELIEDGGPLDVLLVPVGGGGLIAGCATAAAALCPDCRVVGVEPEVGDDTARSLAAGERVRVPVGRTIADGQQLDQPGERTFPVIRERVHAVVTVTDAEIVAAMRFAFERLKLVLEPSGASALAALLSGKVDATGARVGVLLSGGNVDVARFRELTAQISAIRTAILTVSTSVSRRASEDRSGPVLAALAEQAGCQIVAMEVVPDDFGLIEDRLHHFVDEDCDLVFTTGGTGMTPDDITPEATRAVIHREAPGLAEAMRAESARHTPLGILTRGIAGIAEATLIVNFPGSPKAVEELFPVIAPVLGHAVQTLRGESSHGHRHGG